MWWLCHKWSLCGQQLGASESSSDSEGGRVGGALLDWWSWCLRNRGDKLIDRLWSSWGCWTGAQCHRCVQYAPVWNCYGQSSRLRPRRKRCAAYRSDLSPRAARRRVRFHSHTDQARARSHRCWVRDEYWGLHESGSKNVQMGRAVNAVLSPDCGCCYCCNCWCYYLQHHCCYRCCCSWCVFVVVGVEDMRNSWMTYQFDQINVEAWH